MAKLVGGNGKIVSGNGKKWVAMANNDGMAMANEERGNVEIGAW
jgi:hypothetical protein